MTGFRKGFVDDVDAVTPIISTLLLITIMLTIISAILYWSIPAMNRISWDTEFRTSMAGFEALDAALEDTVLGGVSGSTRSFRISVPQGNLLYYPNVARWYVSFTYDSGYDFEIADIADEYEEPDRITQFRVFIRPERPGDDNDFDLTIQWVNDTSTTSQTFDGLEFGDVITPSDPFFGDDSIRYVRFIVRDTATGSPIGEAYLIRLDRLEVKIPSEFGTARICSENGAIVRVYPGDSIINPPVMSYDSEEAELYMNVIPLDVQGIRVVGAGNWKITMRLRDMDFTRIDGAYHVRLRVMGEFRDAWERHLGFEYEDLEPAEDHPVSRTPGAEQDGFHLTRDGPVTLKIIRSTVLLDIRGV